MGKARRVMRCYSCGAVLQSKDKTERGFIPKELLANTIGDNQVLYCQNCFDIMKGLNAGALEQHVDKSIIKILDDAIATDAYVIWVIDLFSFNGTLSPDVVKKVKKLKVAVIGTHRDLFSAFVKDETLIRFVTERYQECGITPDSITLIGNTDEVDFKELLAKFNIARKAHDIYIIGSLYSGKTVLINKLLRNYVNKTKWPIRTEDYKDTNIKVLSIPLTNSSFIYELPGFSLSTSVVGKVEKEVQKIITPKKKIETHYRTLMKGEALVVGSLGYFVLHEGRATAMKFYCAEGVEIKKVAERKADDFIAENNRKRLLRPVSDHLTSFRDYDFFEYQMENDGQVHDISVQGLGWISFVAKGQIIRVMFPKGAALKESLAKLR